MKEALLNFIRFSRVHTVVGTTLSILALYLIALSFAERPEPHFTGLLLTLLSCLGANIYIVGLNQLTDVEIDKINKPWLPLASGAWSRNTAIRIILISVLLSLVLSLLVTRYLVITVLLSLLIGTLYSLPPVRLKRFHFWAAFSIIAVRGLIVNLLLFLNFHALINQSMDIPPVIWLLTASMFIYSIVIAWFKDMPDLEGDHQFRIRTLSLEWGRKKVLRTGSTLISLHYLGLIVAPSVLPVQVGAWFFAGTHLLLWFLFGRATLRVALEDNASIKRYYQYIWVLFFLEYITFAAARWLG